jgi:uncharacterized membrane protein
MGLGRVKKAGTLQPRWIVLLLLAFIFLAAAWLRLYRLGTYSLWLDESHTWLFASSPWAQFLPTLRLIGVHPPFYFFLEKLLVSVLGDSEGSLRLLSLLADLPAILLVAWLGWEIGGAAGALVAGWFWAFNPFTLWYAQEARPYALAALLSIIALICFRKAEARLSRSTLIVASLVLALGLVTHFFFFLTTGAFIILSLLQIRKSPHLYRNWTIMSLIAMLPLVLWLAWFFLLPKPTISIGWIEQPVLADLPLTIWNFLSGYAGLFSLPSALFGVIAGLLLVLGLVAVDNAASNRRIFLAGILLPLLLTWLVSFRRPIYVDRYFIVLLPFLLPILASGGKQALRIVSRFHLPSFLAQGILVCLLLGAGIYNAWQVHSDVKYAREDWRGLAAYLYGQAPSNSPFWFLHSEMVVPFEYYYREPYRLLAVSTPPACTQPCWWVLRQPYTPTHAFTQSVTIPERPWKPDLSPLCQLLDRWDSPTGLAIWKIECH